jgi:hypothetical protein
MVECKFQTHRRSCRCEAGDLPDRVAKGLNPAHRLAATHKADQLLGGPRGRAACHLGVFKGGLGIGGFDHGLRQLHITKDSGQKIIEIVGDSARQRSQGLKALHLGKVILVLLVAAFVVKDQDRAR